MRNNGETIQAIKPDRSFQLKVVEDIIMRGIRNCLSIKELKVVYMSEKMAEEFYAEHKDKPFFQTLVRFSISGPWIFIIWADASPSDDQDVVAVVRELNGDANPAKAKPGSIRFYYGNHNHEKMHENTVHASSTPETFRRERKIIFDS